MDEGESAELEPIIAQAPLQAIIALHMEERKDSDYSQSSGSSDNMSLNDDADSIEEEDDDESNDLSVDEMENQSKQASGNDFTNKILAFRNAKLSKFQSKQAGMIRRVVKRERHVKISVLTQVRR